MSKLKGCTIKVKGGQRCGMPQLEGKKYCKFHVPLPPQPKKLQVTTYALKNYFDGEQTVKAVDYKAYLQSAEWKEKSARIKESNPNCSLCNRKGILHVHHRTYVRCGSEREGDLVVLCGDCHELFHHYYNYDGRVGHFIYKRKP